MITPRPVFQCGVSKFEQAIRRGFDIPKWCLDPSSCVPPRIPTTRYFDGIVLCGLSEQWNGARYILCNPPYSDVPSWADKCISEHEADREKRIVLLVPNSTDTAAFGRIARSGATMLEIVRRLKFVDLSGRGRTYGARTPSVLCVWGATEEEIAAVRVALAESGYETVRVVRDFAALDIPAPRPSPVQLKLRHENCEEREANAIVAAWHRHHKRVAGRRFSIKCLDENGVLRGVAIVGRPVARLTCRKTIVEVTRMCTDGTANACSYLYGACARVAKEMGFKKIQTFILDSEPGTSLKAAGWVFDGYTDGGDGWQSRAGRRNDQPTCRKQRWVKILQSDAKSG